MQSFVYKNQFEFLLEHDDCEWFLMFILFFSWQNKCETFVEHKTDSNCLTVLVITRNILHIWTMDVNQIWHWGFIQNTKFSNSTFKNTTETNKNIVKLKTKGHWLEMFFFFFLQEAKKLSSSPKINSYYFLATVMCKFVSNVESVVCYLLC